MAAVSTFVAVAAVAVSGATAYEANRQAKKAAEKQEEAGKVASAEQAAQQTAQTRAQIREERVRRAQILQSSENTGVTASSGAIGSTGALQTTVGANLASASRQANAANAITGLQQDAADALFKEQQVQAAGGFISSALSFGAGLKRNSENQQAFDTKMQESQQGQGGYQSFVGPQQNLFD